jgi:hypothetical protein
MCYCIMIICDYYFINIVIFNFFSIPKYLMKHATLLKYVGSK